MLEPLRTATSKSEPSELGLDRRTRKFLWLATFVAMTLFLGGCAGKITRVEIDPTTPIVCDSMYGTPCGVSDDQPVNFLVWGEGKCESVRMEYGDGYVFHSGPHDFGTSGTTLTPLRYFSHMYQGGWPGPKTIHAYPAMNCSGGATQSLNVLRYTGDAQSPYHAIFALAFRQPTTNHCNTISNIIKPLRKNTKVTITTNPNPIVKINFGCVLGGCIYDADGEPNSNALAPFPFPGFHKYSLILRVGTQIVQGGTRMAFLTNQGGHLEVCVNDDVLPDNTGAWGINISVDESQSP